MVACVRVVFLGRDRVFWRQAILYVVTLGIYRRVWLFRVNKELDGHEALGINHTLNAVLLCLPVIGPSIVAAQTAGRVARMLSGSGIKFGSPILVYLATWIPIAGNLYFIGWTQTRLNRFWAAERKNPQHGVEIDVKLSDDPAFLIELGRAVRESYHPGSRFDQKRQARRQSFDRRMAAFGEVRHERAAVRAAGGSTPVFPFMRPSLPPQRILHVTCSECATRFDVTQDPIASTPIVCPKCGLNEVLPGLADDPLRPTQKAAVPVLKASCPKCKTKFTSVRNLHGPTVLTCPTCGRVETLAAPARVLVKA